MTRPNFNKNPKAPASGLVKHPCGVGGCFEFMWVNTFQWPYPGQPERSPETEGLTLVQMNRWVWLETMEQTYRWHLEHEHEFTDQAAVEAEVTRYLADDRKALTKMIDRRKAS